MREYVSAITRHFAPEGPIKDTLDERITSLHMKYLAGIAPAVSEQTLVSALNRLASQMKLPEYGKTSPLEFRLFRIAVLRSLPQLNPTALTRPDQTITPDGKLVKTVSFKMSPPEVAYLVGLLQLQKRINPSFQVTEAELQQRYAEYHNGLAGGATSGSGESFAMKHEIGSSTGQPNPERVGVVDSALQSFWKDSTPTRMVDLLNTFSKELGYE